MHVDDAQAYREISVCRSRYKWNLMIVPSYLNRLRERQVLLRQGRKAGCQVKAASGSANWLHPSQSQRTIADTLTAIRFLCRSDAS